MCFSASRSKGFNFLDNIHSLNYFSKYNVPFIKPWTGNSCDEKLGSIWVGSGIGHRQKSWTGMIMLEIFVIEFLSVNGFASSSIMVREITSLKHELRDDSVEDGSFVSIPFFAGAKSSKVLCSFWDSISEKLEDNFSDIFIVGWDFEVCFWVGHKIFLWDQIN